MTEGKGRERTDTMRLGTARQTRLAPSFQGRLAICPPFHASASAASAVSSSHHHHNHHSMSPTHSSSSLYSLLSLVPTSPFPFLFPFPLPIPSFLFPCSLSLSLHGPHPLPIPFPPFSLFPFCRSLVAASLLRHTLSFLMMIRPVDLPLLVPRKHPSLDFVPGEAQATPRACVRECRKRLPYAQPPQDPRTHPCNQ